MILQRALILLTLGSVFALPLSSNAQETAAQRRHRRAVAAQRASDHLRTTPARRLWSVSAASGAVVGGLMGGGKGALIGGALGAGRGAIANKALAKITT